MKRSKKNSAELRAIFDEFDRLGVDMSLPEPAPAPSESDRALARLINSFREIREYIEQHGREPEIQTENIVERCLAARLKFLREDEEKRHKLMPYDDTHLLSRNGGTEQ